MNNEKKLSFSQNAVYNLMGTIFYCFCQWIISAILVVHLSPKDISISNTGILQLSISVTNIFYAISNYNMRTYQISDTNDKYKSSDYIGVRFITAFISLILCVLYSLVLNYSLKSILCISFYMLYKLTDAISDVLHAIDQKHYRMDYVGISQIIKGLATSTVFAISIILTGDILLSIIFMALASAAVIIFYDIRCTRTLDSVVPSFNKAAIFSLLVTCLPAVISSASFIAITSIPRQILEAMQGEDVLAYYGTIATPLVIVQVMATSLFSPMFTELAEYYNAGKIKKFTKRILINLLLLACISGFVLICVVLIGKFAVGLVFGEKFVPYTYLMYGIIGCTSMYVISWLFTNTLIIMRKLKVCMIASLIALFSAICLSKPFINIFGINGVSFCIIIAYFIHMTICFIIISKNLKEQQK